MDMTNGAEFQPYFCRFKIKLDIHLSRNFSSELFLLPGIARSQCLIVTVTVAFRYHPKTGSTRFAKTLEMQPLSHIKPPKK